MQYSDKCCEGESAERKYFSKDLKASDRYCNMAPSYSSSVYEGDSAERKTIYHIATNGRKAKAPKGNMFLKKLYIGSNRGGGRCMWRHRYTA